MDSNSSDDDSSDEDEDDEEQKPNGLVVKDGEIYNEHSVLMTKIDVAFGAWGLYNFYRMQVLSHLKL
jgi:hypothetical protein